MIGVSPTRPGSFSCMPPVEVAAARWPRASRATAPTVPTSCRAAADAAGRSARRLPARALPRRHEQRVVVRGDPDLARERRRARAGEEHVVRPLHDRARERDRVPHVLHDRDRAAAERLAVHDRRRRARRRRPRSASRRCPALNVGSSSSARTAASTASSAVPPARGPPSRPRWRRRHPRGEQRGHPPMRRGRPGRDLRLLRER